MPMAQVAGGHYEPDGIGDGRKVVVNLYSEINENDPNRPMRHVLRPGAIDRGAGVLGSIPRGIGQVDGHADGAILVVDQQTVRTYAPASATWGALSGTIDGSGRVQMAFSEVQGAILSSGRIFISDGSSVVEESDVDYELLLTNHSVTGGFTSIASIGQRLLFTFGSRLGWSDTLDFNSTSTTYFLTTEDSPDLNVAVSVLNGIVYVFGTETIQTFTETGQEGAAAFRPQNNSTVNRGCLARDTIAQVDNTLFFVGDDYAVYRLNGLTPQILSKPWVARKLRLENADDLVASVMELEGHSFYILNGKYGCYVYDALTQEWFVWESYAQHTFEWSQVIEASGDHYAVSRSGIRFAQLSREYVTDLGAEIVWEFSAHLPVIGGRRPIPSIRLDGTKGRGSATNSNADAYVGMALSKDNGSTLGRYRNRSIGKQGEYRKRAIWRQNGRAREPQVILFFRGNDPIIVNGVAVSED